MPEEMDISSLILRYLAIRQMRPRAAGAGLQSVHHRADFGNHDGRHALYQWPHRSENGKIAPQRAAALAGSDLDHILLAPLLADGEPSLSVYVSARGAYVIGCDMGLRGGVTVPDATLYDQDALSAVLAPGKTAFLHHPVRGAEAASGHEMLMSREIALVLEPVIGPEEGFWSGLEDEYDLFDIDRLTLWHDPAGCLVISVAQDYVNGDGERILTVLASHTEPIKPLYARHRFGKQARFALEKASTGRIAPRSPATTKIAREDERVWLFEKSIIDELAKRGVIHGAPDSQDVHVALGSPESIMAIETILALAEEKAGRA